MTYDLAHRVDDAYFSYAPLQGGVTPVASVLPSAIAVKILTEKFYISIAYILRLYILSLKFCLTLTNLYRVYQRDIVA